MLSLVHFPQVSDPGMKLSEWYEALNPRSNPKIAEFPIQLHRMYAHTLSMYVHT
jgi:hypothetical protein